MTQCKFRLRRPILAPRDQSDQSDQTGAEEQNGGGFGDRRQKPMNPPRGILIGAHDLATVIDP